jgi:hypothetical protein
MEQFSDYGLPVVPHICWTDEDEAPRKPISILDALYEARAKVAGELKAIEFETDIYVVQGFRYNSYLMASCARAKIQEALMSRADYLDTQIAHAMGSAA